MDFSLGADDGKPVRTVAIPVKVEKGRLRMLDGSPLPKLAEEAQGVLMMADDAVILSAPDRVVTVCPGGAELLAGVRFDKVPKEQLIHLFDGDPADWPEPTAHVVASPEARRLVVRNQSFVSVLLAEPLLLELSASSTGTLSQAKCYIPALKREAISVNQAYTYLSEAFEPHRAAHTGNVFDVVFIKTKSGWAPLEAERKRLNAEYEKRCRIDGASLFG